MMRYKDFLNEEYFDDLEEEDEEDDPTMVIVGWKGWELEGSSESGFIYILEKTVDETTVILYDNYKHTDYYDKMAENYTILSKDELEKYIYNNKYTITINRNNVFKDYYWEDLPKKIKNLLENNK